MIDSAYSRMVDFFLISSSFNFRWSSHSSNHEFLYLWIQFFLNNRVKDLSVSRTIREPKRVCRISYGEDYSGLPNRSGTQPSFARCPSFRFWPGLGWGRRTFLIGNFGLLTDDFHSSLKRDLHTLGSVGIFATFLRAYSLGGGTYTGIEAVSKRDRFCHSAASPLERNYHDYIADSTKTVKNPLKYSLFPP